MKYDEISCAAKLYPILSITMAKSRRTAYAGGVHGNPNPQV